MQGPVCNPAFNVSGRIPCGTPDSELQNEEWLVAGRIPETSVRRLGNCMLCARPAVACGAQCGHPLAAFSCAQLLPAWKTHRAQTITPFIEGEINRTRGA